MKKYIYIFSLLTFFSLKASLAYRLNFLFKLFHGPVYVGVLLSLLLIAFHRTETLSGWTKPEALLLFSVFHMVYTNCLIIFLNSIRHLLWQGFRLGEVDGWLLKPGSTQFYLTFSRPDTDLFMLWILVCCFFVYQLSSQPYSNIYHWLGFWFLFILAHAIVYFSLSLYSTLGFFVTRVNQIVEVFDKASDFSQYPLTIFPQSIQVFLTTVLPTAFFSYFPVMFLKGEGSLQMIVFSISVVVVLATLNQIAWKQALKHYSSASS